VVTRKGAFTDRYFGRLVGHRLPRCGFA
jgi:hypothetical protein